MTEFNLLDSETFKLQKIITINYAKFKNLYHYLQSKSKAFPQIDSLTIRKFFIAPMNIKDQTHMSVHEIDTIFQKSIYDEDDNRSNNRFLNRSQLQIFCMRLAVSMYCDPKILKENFLSS